MWDSDIGVDDLLGEREVDLAQQELFAAHPPPLLCILPKHGNQGSGKVTLHFKRC